MSLSLKSFVMVVIITMGSMVNAASVSDMSPALKSYPGQLFNSFRSCIKNDGFFEYSSKVADQLEAWFAAFRRPSFQQLLIEVRAPDNKPTMYTSQNANSLVHEVRKLVDYQTEQALISMIDAAVRKYNDSPVCRDTVSQLILRIAAQRDRAWTWAEIVEGQLRLLKIREGNWKVGQQFTDTLLKVERSYEWFERYKK